jgi:hypothetical protein
MSAISIQKKRHPFVNEFLPERGLINGNDRTVSDRHLIFSTQGGAMNAVHENMGGPNRGSARHRAQHRWVYKERWRGFEPTTSDLLHRNSYPLSGKSSPA